MRELVSSIKVPLSILVRVFIYIIVFLSFLQIMNVISLDTETSLQLYGIGSVLLLLHLNIIKIQKFSPSYTVVLYTIFTHFGFGMVYLVTIKYEFVNFLMLRSHLYLEYLPTVFAISFVGVSSFFSGWSIKQILSKGKMGTKKTKSIHSKRFSDKLRSTYLIISTFISYGFAITLLGIVLRGGLLSIGYIEIKEALSVSFYSYLQMLFWISIVPIAVLGDKKTFILNSMPIILITVLLLATGNRNDILYPLSIAFSLYCLVHKKVPTKLLIVGLIIVFIINPAIAATRKEGLFSLSDLSFGFIDATREMGGQVSPFSIVIHFVENGMQKMHGLSMILPTLAVLNLNIFYTTSEYLNSLYHIPNVIALHNHYGRAFSMIAEMWINFGVVGVALVYGIYGYLSNKIEKATLTHKELIFYGQFSVLMMYWVRNALMFNILLIIFSISMYLVAVFTTKVRNSINE